jgi:hypothetical protein
VRVAAWVFIVCTLLGAVSVFLPSAELAVNGVTLGRRTSLSLYQAANNRELVRRFVANYHRSGSRRMGSALAGVLVPKVGGHLRAHLDDVRDAMSTLDDISDDDAKTLGKVLVAVVWLLIVLHLVMGLLVFGDTLSGVLRRGRVIAAVAISVVVTVLAVVIRMITSEAVWEANDEIGKQAVDLGVAAYLMPVVSIAGLVAIVVVLVQLIRSRRKPASQ